MTRVQVILDEAEKEAFRHVAREEGMSLSAWLRRAGRERLSARRGRPRIRTVKDLRAFFAACDRRERGREPDWEEHLAVIERSIRASASGT
jgi:hypothetical protein